MDRNFSFAQREFAGSRIAAMLAFSVCALAASPVAAQDDAQFPYRAYVQADQVYIRSGPGSNYYPSSQLNRGDIVEVYRHDPGGWCAIRPPKASFSWIAAEFVKPLKGQLGEITGDEVVARVGSTMSDTRDVIQVRLDRGEQVYITEAQRIGSGPAARTWYKVLPPPGEFRWVASKFLGPEPPVTERRDRGPDGNMIVARMERERRGSAGRGPAMDRSPNRELRAGTAEARIAQVSRRDDEEVARERPLPTERVALSGRSADERETRGSGSDESYDEEESEDDWRAAYRDLPATRPYSPLAEAEIRERRFLNSGHADEWSLPKEPHRVDDEPVTTSDMLASELEELDVALSKIVAEEPYRWELAPLATRAEVLMEKAADSADRERVIALSDKLDRFARIQQEHTSMLAARTRAPGGAPRLASAASDPAVQMSNGPALPATSSTARFDGLGRLTEVVPRDASAASFALLDQSGSVRYYVTPAPGMNLRPYLGQQVGVSGTIGYMPDAQTQHVTAKQIEVVGGKLLR